MWHFSIFIGNRRKHKTTDIWRCANEDQCVPDKTGCSCRTITRGVRLARQGCWCCACRSSSPVLHESYCRITSMRKTKRGWSPGDSLNLVCVLSVRVNYSQQCRNDINGRWEYSKSIIQNFSSTKMLLEISYAKWWPFCSGEDELTVFLGHQGLFQGRATYSCWHQAK